MRARLFEVLACPGCRADLELAAFREAIMSGEAEILDGLLTCANGHRYPVVNGVPRMLPDAFAQQPAFRRQYAAQLGEAGTGEAAFSGGEDAGVSQVRQRFEFQWQQWGNEERIFGKSFVAMREILINERIGTAINADFYPGKLVLDAGCGHGRYLAAFESLGAEVVGLDIGLGIELAQQFNAARPRVHLVQGNVLMPPFKLDVFDLIFSDGVLQFTPSTEMAFRALSAHVAPGGYFYVWVYPKEHVLWEVSQRFLRAITTRLPPRQLYYLCFLPVPLLSVVKTYSGTSLKNSSWRQCAQVVWDWYSPKYQWHHTPAEVRGWYAANGFEAIEMLPVPVGVVGRRPFASNCPSKSSVGGDANQSNRTSAGPAV